MIELLLVVLATPTLVAFIVVVGFPPRIRRVSRGSKLSQGVSMEVVRLTAENNELRERIRAERAERCHGPYRSRAYQLECNCPCTGRCSSPWYPGYDPDTIAVPSRGRGDDG